ncbi:uncharacterized protein LOC120354609 [Nilaparvata lugens]|uniref:uncharacterized protein LOC120354609 n=1 Tax=Nilaparvata lugens TaxID=108931 RepID=UPI00193E1F6A|nr:uncharacterized protein LOC120354609 [Nilaparvata lugens]
MYADDVKLFDRVLQDLGHESLQNSLNNLDLWCLDNGMALNVTKCVLMSFKRGTSILDSQYSLRGIPLKRVYSFKDLGVTMTQSFSPLDHMSVITGEARSLLGFIFRTTRDFSSPESVLVLFRALVLLVLEYGSIIWAPFHLYQINLLQSVERRFVRMLSCRMGFKYFEVPVEEIKGQYISSLWF